MPKNAVNPERVARFASISASPRVKMAARLYASAAVPTKKAACEAVGLSPYYLSLLSRASVQNPEVTSILGEVDQAIHDKAIAMSAVVALIARRAASKMNNLIDSQNEHVAFKAAADILDRNPDTSKTQKLQVSSFSLEGQDAKELAHALVRAAEVKTKFREIGAGDFVKVTEEDPNAKRQPFGVRGEHAEEGGSGDRPSGEEQGIAPARGNGTGVEGNGNAEAGSEEGHEAR